MVSGSWLNTLDFVDTFDFHRTHPNQSFEDYYRSIRLVLSQNVLDRKIVYLDTKFWVLLRKGFLDGANHASEQELLKLSIDLVEQGKCIFPISEDVFLEVIKQTDNGTLRATTDLIDVLSQGVSIISHEERVKLEIIHFWYSSLGKDVYEAKELVWTKLPYLMGVNSFETPMINAKENLVLNKAFVDQMWSISMRQMVEIILENGGINNLCGLALAEALNEGKLQHESEAKSFNQMFLNEVGGVIDLYRDDLADMMEYMYQKDTGKELSGYEEKRHRDKTKRMMGNMIYNLFRLNKAGQAMPAFRIPSALHAAVRWDIKQKFQDHDLHDFRHAASALPYCDYFFTEKRLKHLLCQKSLSFHKLYDCEVFSKPKNAIDALMKINN